MTLDFLLDDDEKEGVLFFDLSQIALASAMHEIDPGQQITLPLLRHLVLNSLRYNIVQGRKEGYTKVILTIDNATNGYWRKHFAYYYKQNRSNAREESKFDWNAYFNAFNQLVQELMANMPYIVINVDHAESDDGIAVLTKCLALAGHRIKIISSDSDFTQLHKYPGVIQWSPMQKKLVKSKTGSPMLDMMTKVVKGDRKDCVSGIKVRSDFYLTKLDGERSPPIKAKFVEDILDAYQEHGVEYLLTSKLLNEVEHKRFKENQVLIDFDHIKEDIVQNILTAYNEYKPASRKKMYSYFVKSGLSKLLSKINDF